MLSASVYLKLERTRLKLLSFQTSLSSTEPFQQRRACSCTRPSTTSWLKPSRDPWSSARSSLHQSCSFQVSRQKNPTYFWLKLFNWSFFKSIIVAFYVLSVSKNSYHHFSARLLSIKDINPSDYINELDNFLLDVSVLSLLATLWVAFVFVISRLAISKGLLPVKS